MADRSRFDEAVHAISAVDAGRKNLCGAFLSVLPVTGVSVSVLGSFSSPATICSSDRRATRLDELQFDLGEGPCWQALSSRLPVLSENIRAKVPSEAWPSFVGALEDERVGGVFAFPLAIGTMGIGAVDLYTEHPARLHQGNIADASALAGFAAWQVLRRVLVENASREDSGADESGLSRREFHQATGMVLAQMGIAASDAALLIRAHAYSAGRSVIEVSRDVLERELVFSEEMS